MIKVQPDLQPDDQRGLKVDLTSMIDVIFTVIAFMMIIINVPVQTMQVDLPDNDASASVSQTETILLHVLDKAESWRVNDGEPTDRTATLNALKASLRAKPGAPAILISIDEDTPAQRMVETFSLLQAGQFENVSIVTEDPGAPS